ncbi:hypothetical protein D3C81_401970 [compost metagenome]
MPQPITQPSSSVPITAIVTRDITPGTPLAADACAAAGCAWLPRAAVRARCLRALFGFCRERVCAARALPASSSTRAQAAHGMPTKCWWAASLPHVTNCPALRRA